MGPANLANHRVPCHLCDLEALFNGVIRALAKAGVFGKRVTGIANGTDLETTERYAGCGQVTRKHRIEDTWGRVYEIEVTVYGWKVLLVIDAVTKIPLAVKVVQIQEHEALGTRALVTQARALAEAGEGVTVGRRIPTVRHGQGRTAWRERLATEVVGISGLTTYEPYGTEEHGRRHHRCDFKPTPINAVMVRQWQGKDYGPGGKTVFLTHASVQQSLQPFDDDDDRSLIALCCIKGAK